MRVPTLRSGSRFVPGAKHDYSGLRLTVSQGANMLASSLLRLPIAEHTTSLRAAKLARVPDGLVETIESDGYGFFVTCVVRLARAGLTFAELPIHFRDRADGVSKISKRQIVFGALNLLPPQRGSPPICAARLAIRIAGLSGLRPAVPDARAVRRIALPGVLRLAGLTIRCPPRTV